MGCRGARARAEAARVPLPRGGRSVCWCARVSSPALFCGCGRTWDVRRGTLAALGEPVRQAKVLRLTSYVLSTAAKMAAPHTAAPAGSQCLGSHVSGLPASHLASGGSARGWLFNSQIQSKNLIAFRGLDLVEYPPRAKKRDD